MRRSEERKKGLIGKSRGEQRRGEERIEEKGGLERGEERRGEEKRADWKEEMRGVERRKGRMKIQEIAFMICVNYVIQGSDNAHSTITIIQ